MTGGGDFDDMRSREFDETVADEYDAADEGAPPVGEAELDVDERHLTRAAGAAEIGGRVADEELAPVGEAELDVDERHLDRPAAVPDTDERG